MRENEATIAEGGFSFRPPEWHDELESTNTFLKERQAAAPCSSGTVVAAGNQTRGRGRMGNSWISLPGRDLTFSFVWTGRGNFTDAATLPMACALGITDFLETCGVAAQCKWPNDVMCGGGKICGIITEAMSLKNGLVSLIVGVGVNVRSAAGRFSGIAQKATTIEDEVKTAFAPGALLPGALAKLQRRIRQWEAGGFKAIKPDYVEKLWGAGSAVSVRDGGAVAKER